MISVALTSTGLATPVATRMLTVGERSGQMGEIMDRIARSYDDETARFVEVFTRVFEPLLMTVLGLAVGLVVVLMYMPVFELAGSIRCCGNRSRSLKNASVRNLTRCWGI